MEVTVHVTPSARAVPTIALVLGSTCRFCAASMPFYQQLARLRASGRLRLVVMSAEPASAIEAFVLHHRLEVDEVTALRGSGIEVSGTPTVVLFTPDGRIEGRWIGQLAAMEERELLDRVGGPAV